MPCNYAILVLQRRASRLEVLLIWDSYCLLVDTGEIWCKSTKYVQVGAFETLQIAMGGIVEAKFKSFH